MTLYKIFPKLKSISYSLFYFIFEKVLPHGNNVIAGTVVSFTSYGNRLDKVHLVVSSILKQTYRPETIVLYLYENDMDRAIGCKKLKKLVESELLLIKSTAVDYKSYKKIILVEKDFPDYESIITIDDDIIYPRYWLQSLLKEKDGFDGVVCGLARQVPQSEDLGVPYSEWELAKPGDEGPHLLPIGVGGVLYPVGILRKYLDDWHVIKELAYTADDIWLNLSVINAGFPVRVARNLGFHPPELPTEIFKSGLFRVNRQRNESIYWRVKRHMRNLN